MEQKQKAWKDKYIAFQEKEVRTKLYIGIMSVLVGGFLFAIPVGTILALTYGGVPTNNIVIRLSDAMMGGFCVIFGTLFSISGVSMILDNRKELHSLDKLKSEA